MSKLFVQRITSLFQQNGRLTASLYTSTSVYSNSFTIQDTRDFDERVKNSKVPVIVDFFAT